MKIQLVILLSIACQHSHQVPVPDSSEDGSGEFKVPQFEAPVPQDDGSNTIITKSADEFGLLRNYSVPQNEASSDQIQDSLAGLPQPLGNSSVSRKKRGIYLKQIYIWDDKEIPYEIGDMPTSLVDEVEDTMTMLESQTCVRFVRPEDSDYESKKANGFLKFVSGIHCSSKNGKIADAGEFQELRLNDACNLNVVVHELLHTLGIKHEHKRPDRDNYITVHNDVIDPDMTFQFEQEPANKVEFQMGYDISSIMHYSQWAYGLNDQKSITLKEELYTHTQGGVDTLGGAVRGTNVMNLLSHRDKATINRLYSCDESCGGKTCENNGFVDKTCNCVCPQGFTGDSCETFDAESVGHDALCGPSDLTGSNKIKPPAAKNSAGKKGFRSGISCFWRISAPEGQVVELKLEKLWLDSQGGSGNKFDGECKASVPGIPNSYPDWLQIYIYGSDVDVQPISCLSNDKSTFLNKWYTTSTNEVFVKWTSVKQESMLFNMRTFQPYTEDYDPANNKGFKLLYRMAPA